MWVKCLFVSFTVLVDQANARGGIMLLYRPQDITTNCAYSDQLTYDISFGMGLSDTITLVLRNAQDIDYQCKVNIVADTLSHVTSIIVVIRYPTPVGSNCMHNPKAFTVMTAKTNRNLCREAAGRDTNTYFYSITVENRFSFKFISNSSINSEIGAHLYEVTATAARKIPHHERCHKINETLCIMNSKSFCITSGAVCDGIKNCGVPDWFDERKSYCLTSEQGLSFRAVAATAAAMVFLLGCGAYMLLKCLPPVADSFFIFNVNEDNRLRVAPLLTAGTSQSARPNFIYKTVSPSTSAVDHDTKRPKQTIDQVPEKSNTDVKTPSRKLRTMTLTMVEKIHEKMRRLSTLARNISTQRT